MNVQDIDGCTALHLASAEDLEGRCVEHLLGSKADAVLRDKVVSVFGPNTSSSSLRQGTADDKS